MKKLLWVGDAACPSGFARATHGILDTLRDYYDVTVLGINYRGDPHSYPYPIYAAAASDYNLSNSAMARQLGVDRLLWMCHRIKPDVIVLQNDGWNIPAYTQMLVRAPEYSSIPVVAAVAVDGKNFLGPWLTGVSMAVFWTQFALDEARAGGYAGPATVIPLGVDTGIYRPQEQKAARLRHFKGYLSDAFIVGNVNRNQPRKRWDLMIKYFAKWITTYKIDDAHLYLHVAPTGDIGVDVQQLARYYGVFNRLVLVEPPVWQGMSEDSLADSYNCFDVCASTTQGEGFGLTALEAMACGIPCVLPDWSALGDWAKRGAWLVPCTSTAVGPPYVNVVGGVPDEGKFVQALHALYSNHDARKQNAQAALECARQEKFEWSNIGRRWAETLEATLSDADLIKPAEEVPA